MAYPRSKAPGFRFPAVLGACVAGIGATFLPTHADARVDFTVKQMLGYCAADQTQKGNAVMICNSYFLGLADMMDASSALYGAKIPICYPPGGLSVSDMILTFRLWASTTKDVDGLSATAGILQALVKQFPCPH